MDIGVLPVRMEWMIQLVEFSPATLTDFRRALRRKKALHDIQVTTSKFNPRAISPQTRQTSGGFAETSFEEIFFDSIDGKIIWFENIRLKGSVEVYCLTYIILFDLHVTFRLLLFRSLVLYLFNVVIRHVLMKLLENFFVLLFWPSIRTNRLVRLTILFPLENKASKCTQSSSFVNDLHEHKWSNRIRSLFEFHTSS